MFPSINTIKITLTSFLAYFLMSSIISPLGLLTAPMAEVFETTVASTTAVFSYLTTGLLVGSLTAIFVIERIGVKWINVAASGLIIVILTLLWFIRLFDLIPILFLGLGWACGLLLSAAAVVITATYSEKHRAQMLLVTDSFYSGAGFISGMVAGYLLSRNVFWSGSYVVAAVAAGLLLFLALTSIYPKAEKKTNDEADAVARERWPAAYYLIGAALFVYIMSFAFIYSWVPNYAVTVFNIGAKQSGELVSRFFGGLFIGQLAIFGLIFLINQKVLILAIIIAAPMVTTGLWLSQSADQLGIAMLVSGLVSGGLLKTLIAFGTSTVSNPSSKMVSILIFSTALGSSIAPAFSAWVVSSFDVHTAMIAVTAGFSIMAFMVALAMLLQQIDNRSLVAE